MILMEIANFGRGHCSDRQRLYTMRLMRRYLSQSRHSRDLRDQKGSRRHYSSQNSLFPILTPTEVLEGALLVDGGCEYHFDESLHVKDLHWVVSVGKEEKMQANQVEYLHHLYRKLSGGQMADTMRPKDVHAASQTGHVSHSLEYVNMAVVSHNYVEGVREQEESREVAMWRMGKGRWAGVVRADRPHVAAVVHMSCH